MWSDSEDSTASASASAARAVRCDLSRWSHGEVRSVCACVRRARQPGSVVRHRGYSSEAVSRSPCRIGSAECTGYSCMTMSRYVSIVDKQGRGRLAETDTPHESRQRYTTSDVRLTYSQFGILSIAIVFIDRPHRAHRPLKGDTRQTGTSERGRAPPDKLHSRTQCSGRSGLFSL